MTIKYVLLVNKQGQTRLSKYYTYYPPTERISMEGNIIRQCLSRSTSQVNSNNLLYLHVTQFVSVLLWIIKTTLLCTEDMRNYF